MRLLCDILHTHKEAALSHLLMKIGLILHQSTVLLYRLKVISKICKKISQQVLFLCEIVFFDKLFTD